MTTSFDFAVKNFLTSNYSEESISKTAEHYIEKNKNNDTFDGRKRAAQYVVEIKEMFAEMQIASLNREEYDNKNKFLKIGVAYLLCINFNIQGYSVY